MDATLFSSPTWFYIDSDGLERGPFGAEDMLGWYRDGYFPAHLLVRRNFHSNFTRLSSLARGNAVQPVVNIHPAAKPQKHYFVSRTGDFVSEDPFGKTKAGAGKTELLDIIGTETDVEYVENEIEDECLKLEIKECVKSEIKDECLKPKMIKEYIKSETNVECTKLEMKEEYLNTGNEMKEEYLNTGNEREVPDSLHNNSFSFIANAKTEIKEEWVEEDLVSGCPQRCKVKQERSELIQHCLGILRNREDGIQKASKRKMQSCRENVEKLSISTTEKTDEFQSQTVKESSIREQRKTPLREPRKKQLYESIKTPLLEHIKTPLLGPRKKPLHEPIKTPLLEHLKPSLGEPRKTLLREPNKIPLREPKKIPLRAEPTKTLFSEPRKTLLRDLRKIPLREQRNSLLGKRRKKPGDCVNNSIAKFSSATSKVSKIKKQRNVKTVYLRVQNHLPSPFSGTKDLHSDSKFVQIPMKMKDGKYRYCVVKFGNEQECTNAKYKLPINTLLKEKMFYVYFVGDKSTQRSFNEK